MKNLITTLIITLLLSSCISDNDTLQLNNTSLDFTELITFQADTLELDMISSVNENSIYITYSADNGFNENVLKYNLSTFTQDNLIHSDASESRQIEIIDDLIYSVSSNDIYSYDLNLNNLTTVSNSYNDSRYLRTVTYDDNLYIISGNTNVLSFEIDSETYSFESPNSPYGYRNQRDGEIFNDNIYMFGGQNYGYNNWDEPEVVNSFNEITVYNITNETWNQEQGLPYEVFESFTSKYNNSIIVTGNKNQDYSNPFIGIYDLSLNTFNELDTSLNLDEITIRGITILNDEIYLAYTNMITPMPDILTIKVVKASLL